MGSKASRTPSDVIFEVKNLTATDPFGSRKVLEALMEKSSSFKLETRKALQAKLAENGLYDGPIDGDFGPTTRRSIRRAYGILEAEN